MDKMIHILPLPTLPLSDLLETSQGQAFPLNQSNLETTYLGRNAVWQMATDFELSGHEVIVPAYHHGVEVEALLSAGVIPVFARVNEHLELDLQHMESLVSKKTKALYVIHYLGYPQNLQAMVDFTQRHGLLLLEDCALSLYSKDNNVPLGSVGDASIFCFYKTLPVPHGGALWHRRPMRRTVSQRPPPLLSTVSLMTGSALLNAERQFPRVGSYLRQALRNAAKRPRQRAQNALVPVGTQHFDPQALHLGMSRLSEWTLRHTDVQRVVQKRRQNYQWLLNELGPKSTLWPALPAGMCPLFFPLRVADKDKALAHFHSHGILAIDFWRWGHPSCASSVFPEVERLRQTVLELPCHQALSRKELSRIAACAKSLERL